MPLLRRPVKKWIAMAAVPVALALTACGSSGSSSSHSAASGASSGGTTAAASAATSTSAATGSSHKSVNLAIITPATSQNSFLEIADGAKAAADGTPGVHLTSAAPAAINPSAQVQMFQSATTTSRDGIAADPVAPPVFVRPFQTAVSSGIPVVSVDAAALPGSKVNTFVGNSNTQLGMDLATEIVKKIPASTSGYVVLGDDAVGLPLMTQRLNGMKAVLHKERPKLTILGPFNVGAEPSGNFDQWSNLVKAHPDGVAYLGSGSQDAVSLALIEKQTSKHYLVGGCDVDPNALQAVKNGFVDALADPWHFLKGYIAIKLLAAKAQGGTALPTGWFDTGSGMVTAADVAKVIAREQDNTTRVAYFKAIIAKELGNPKAYLRPLSAAN